jgi:uncharacterized protein
MGEAENREPLEHIFARMSEGDLSAVADLILADGDRVAVQAHSRATTKRGERYDQTYLYIFTVADGQITAVIEHCDTALVERVLDPPPSRR